jgi:hypothetical protein
MKHNTKQISCRANQWRKHGDSRRVDILVKGTNDMKPCLICGNKIEDHGWMDGVGIVHPGDWLVDIAGQTLVLRNKTYKELLEREEP